MGGRHVGRENWNPRILQLLQPGIDDRQGAKRLNDGVGALGNQGLQLRHQLLVVPPPVKCQRLPAQALHFIDLRLVGLEIPVMLGAGRADGDPLAGQRRNGGLVRDGSRYQIQFAGCKGGAGRPVLP